MKMQERKDDLAISFWTSLIGVGLAAVAASAFLVWGRSESIGRLVFAATPVFFSLMIRSITAAENDIKPNQQSSMHSTIPSFRRPGHIVMTP